MKFIEAISTSDDAILPCQQNDKNRRFLHFCSACGKCSVQLGPHADAGDFKTKTNMADNKLAFKLKKMPREFGLSQYTNRKHTKTSLGPKKNKATLQENDANLVSKENSPPIADS